MWLGAVNLCTGKRIGMSDARAKTCVKDLQSQHESGGEWSMTEVRTCNVNLLTFYHDRLAFNNEYNKLSDYPLANNFCIFDIQSSHRVRHHQKFSNKTRYTKSLHRSRLSDAFVSTTLHLQQL